jgi:hypothetical protein
MSDQSLTLFGAEPVPAKRRSRPTGDADFDRWWDQYPRRVDKESARKAYARVIKAGRATPDELLAGAMRYAAEKAGEDPRFTKHPATWLNAGSWANEPLAPRPVQRNRADSAIDGILSYFTDGAGHE